MKKAKVILPFLLGVVLTICANASGNGEYAKSYFGRQMSEDAFRQFRGVLRQFYRNEPGLEDVRVQAEAFFDYLATVEEPDFSAYADGDVNADPVGVLWAQLELAMQGKEVQLRVPNDFRKLQLALQVWNGRPDSEFVPELRYKLFYDAYRRLGPSALLVDEAKESAYSIFFHRMFEQLRQHVDAGVPWAKSFLSDWVAGKIDIGRLDWDPQLQEALISMHNFSDYPFSWFPVIMRYNAAVSGLYDAWESKTFERYSWIMDGLLDHFQSIGSQIGAALYLCDPDGDGAPSSDAIESANQGRWREAFLQEPFPWVGLADYLLWSAEMSLIPHESGAKDVVLADAASVSHESGEIAGPATDRLKRRTIAGLHELGFPVETILSRMTEQERISFCETWPEQSKEALAKFRYMLHFIQAMQNKNAGLMHDLWQSRMHDSKASGRPVPWMESYF